MTDFIYSNFENGVVNMIAMLLLSRRAEKAEYEIKAGSLEEPPLPPGSRDIKEKNPDKIIEANTIFNIFQASQRDFWVGFQAEKIKPSFLTSL